MTGSIRWVIVLSAGIGLSGLQSVQARTSTTQEPSSNRCIALPLPSLRGADSSATDLAASLRDLVASFLTGPSLRTVTLDARLAAQAAEEAQQKDCGAILTISLNRKKSGGGMLGRVVGNAAGAAAWNLPYGGSAGTAAARSAAMAGAAATSSLAANTKAKDELHVEYRLSFAGTDAVHEGRDSIKAKVDGEDVVTPLVERMAAAVAAAVTK